MIVLRARMVELADMCNRFRVSFVSVLTIIVVRAAQFDFFCFNCRLHCTELNQSLFFLVLWLILLNLQLPLCTVELTEIICSSIFLISCSQV